MRRFTLEERIAREARLCKATDCDRPEFAKGYCTRCLQRLRRNGTLDLRRKPRCRCHPDAHRVGCPGAPKPLAQEDHPLLVELLDELEPELRSGEGLIQLVRRLKADAAKYHEVTWNPEGRDAS